MVTGIETGLISIEMIFITAGIVGAVTSKFVDVPYTIALLITGMILSFVGLEIGFELSHDVILLVLLPPLLFEGAATTDFSSFRKNFLIITLIAIVGLSISVIGLGVAVWYFLGIPLIFSLLFAAVILPTDPVSVLAIFKEVGAPEDLSTIVEGESLVNDGVGVVLFTTIIGLIESGSSVQSLLNTSDLASLTVSVGVSVVGGGLVGVAIGYAVYKLIGDISDGMTEIVLSIALAYGSFLVAEHYLGVSGVLATVAAGLLIGNRGATHAMDATSRIKLFSTWETGAFITNTFIFVSMGLLIPLSKLVDNLNIIIPAIILVLLARTLVVYPLTFLHNIVSSRNISIDSVSTRYQHVMVWGGLHGSIPIALALGIPAGVAHRETIQILTFGVVAFSLIVQGMSMEWLIHKLGITTQSDAEKAYDFLLGTAQSLDSAIDKVENLGSKGEIPQNTYLEAKNQLEKEKGKVKDKISQLLSAHPEVNREKELTAERRIRHNQKAAVIKGMREGTINRTVGEKLLEDINTKIETVNSGESSFQDNADVTVVGFSGFWVFSFEPWSLCFSTVSSFVVSVLTSYSCWKRVERRGNGH